MALIAYDRFSPQHFWCYFPSTPRPLWLAQLRVSGTFFLILFSHWALPSCRPATLVRVLNLDLNVSEELNLDPEVYEKLNLDLNFF